MTTKYRVSLGFSRLGDAALDSFTGHIITNVDGNPGFTSPVVPIATLSGAKSEFESAIVAAMNGGKVEVATKNEKRAVVLDLLRKEAAYVQSIAGDDLPLLLSSGFNSVSTNRTRVELAPPVVERIENRGGGQFNVRVKPVATAHSYELQVRYGTNGWQTAGIFTNSRSMVIPNLTPGTVYDLQARAVGGSTGYSLWSNPVSCMAT